MGKKANSELRGAEEGSGQCKSLSKGIKIGEKLPSNCRFRGGEGLVKKVF